MVRNIILIVWLVSSVSGNCGTNGCGTRKCVNDKSLTCTDCGCSPCVDVFGVCWSCAGQDSRCYAYDCGWYCSSHRCATSAVRIPRAAMNATGPYEPSITVQTAERVPYFNNSTYCGQDATRDAQIHILDNQIFNASFTMADVEYVCYMERYLYDETTTEITFPDISILEDTDCVYQVGKHGCRISYTANEFRVLCRNASLIFSAC